MRGEGFGQQGVRRRPVVAKDDQGERILTIVSQLDVVRWLSRHHKELSPAFSNITIQNVVEVRLLRSSLHSSSFYSSSSSLASSSSHASHHRRSKQTRGSASCGRCATS
jgi:hypothetical protein